MHTTVPENISRDFFAKRSLTSHSLSLHVLIALASTRALAALPTTTTVTTVTTVELSAP